MVLMRKTECVIVCSAAMGSELHRWDFHCMFSATGWACGVLTHRRSFVGLNTAALQSHVAHVCVFDYWDMFCTKLEFWKVCAVTPHESKCVLCWIQEVDLWFRHLCSIVSAHESGE